LLSKHSKIVNEKFEIKEEKINQIHSLSIYFLYKGYQGIVIPDEEYIEMLGFNPNEKINKPCAFEGQSLINHTENTLKKALKMKHDFEIMSRRYRSIGLNINIEKVEKLIKGACILHDLGKLADEYQESFNDDCSCKGKYSFYLHEVPSAYYAYKQLKSIEDYELNFDAKRLLALAILFHISGKNIDDLIDEVEKTKKKWSFNKYWKDFEVLISKYGIKLDYKPYINTQEALDFLKEIKKIMANKNYRYLKLYNLIYGPICIGDNLDSYENRRTDVSESRKIFLNELYEVIGNE